MNLWRLWLLPALLLTVGCDTAIKPVTFFGADEIPQRLSDWRLLIVDEKNLRFHNRVVPYDLNTP